MTRTGAPLAVIYIGCIVAANVLTNRYGLVHLEGTDLLVTAGTFTAGFALIARNLTQDATGRVVVLALMAVGIGLSYWLASAQLAEASAVAFALSEVVDMGIYTPLRSRGFVKAAALATLVGAVVDTYVFLYIAGYPITRQSVEGQLLVKVGVCWLAIALLGVGRGVLRNPVYAESA